jgi:hypothetical protein
LSPAAVSLLDDPFTAKHISRLFSEQTKAPTIYGKVEGESRR